WLLRGLYPYSRPTCLPSKREKSCSCVLSVTCLPPRLRTVKHFAPQNLTMLVDDLIDHPVFLSLLRVHDVVALDVFFDAFRGLPRMFRQERIDGREHTQDFFFVNVNVLGLLAQPGQPGL